MTDWRRLATEVADAVRAAPAESSEPPEPGGAAAPGSIDAAEARLGEPLPEDYRSFLSEVDGWRGLLFDLDLFDVAALGAPPEPDGPLDLFLESYLPELPDETVQELFGGPPDNALPIGVSRYGTAVVLVGRAGTPIAGRIIEHTGEDTGWFPSIEAFLLDRIQAARHIAGQHGD